MLLQTTFILFFGAAMSSPPLKTISYGISANGFNEPARGWNTFGVDSNKDIVSGWALDQDHVQSQCDILASKLSGKGFSFCSLDSGWSEGANGDEYGRIVPDGRAFPKFVEFADHLHSSGLQLGVYVIPGAFRNDMNKPIFGTNTTIGSACSGDNHFARCNWNYTHPDTQKWFDSVANQFASWGIDLIKLDYIRPGSPEGSDGIPDDVSGEVVAWHKAIAQCGRKIRLNISWKLDRSKEYFTIWNQNAESMRTDQDINNRNQKKFVEWDHVLRAIENYRQWIVDALQYFDTVDIRPDMDNLYVFNDPSISGISWAQQQTMMSHWVGAGANIMLGGDLTKIDDSGFYTLTHEASRSITSFTSRYPMQPRNPGSGSQNAQQLQAWVAGPSPSGEAVVLLVNYGPTKSDSQAGFKGDKSGTQHVFISYTDLGIEKPSKVYDVWNNNDWGNIATGLDVDIQEGQSFLLHLTV